MYIQEVYLSISRNESLSTSSISTRSFSSFAGPVNIAQKTGLLDTSMYGPRLYYHPETQGMFI